jgi:hypothetical protein
MSEQQAASDTLPWGAVPHSRQSMALFDTVVRYFTALRESDDEKFLELLMNVTDGLLLLRLNQEPVASKREALQDRMLERLTASWLRINDFEWSAAEAAFVQKFAREENDGPAN